MPSKKRSSSDSKRHEKRLAPPFSNRNRVLAVLTSRTRFSEAYDCRAFRAVGFRQRHRERSEVSGDERGFLRQVSGVLSDLVKIPVRSPHSEREIQARSSSGVRVDAGLLPGFRAHRVTPGCEQLVLETRHRCSSA